METYNDGDVEDEREAALYPNERELSEGKATLLNHLFDVHGKSILHGDLDDMHQQDHRPDGPGWEHTVDDVYEGLEDE